MTRRFHKGNIIAAQACSLCISKSIHVQYVYIIRGHYGIEPMDKSQCHSWVSQSILRHIFNQVHPVTIHTTTLCDQAEMLLGLKTHNLQTLKNNKDWKTEPSSGPRYALSNVE